MKHFIAIRKNDKYQRRSGSTLFDLEVYEVKGNVPQFVGSKQISTGSMRGEISEAAHILVEKKKIPKTWLTDNGYFPHNNTKYNIHTL